MGGGLVPKTGRVGLWQQLGHLVSENGSAEIDFCSSSINSKCQPFIDQMLSTAKQVQNFDAPPPRL